jgi:CheY-like chemotaxis protein
MQKHKAKILVVEDNPDHMKLAKLILYYSYFEVYEAWNGQEGLEKAAQYKPDVILMDIDMPVKDGVTALKELKENETTASIPVIMLTCLPEHEALCKNIGCQGFLSKPFTPYFLEAEIRKVLPKSKLYRQRVF